MKDTEHLTTVSNVPLLSWMQNDTCHLPKQQQSHTLLIVLLAHLGGQ